MYVVLLCEGVFSMFRNLAIIVFSLILSFFQPTFGQEYRDIHQEKLDNGVSVIFIDANSSDMLLVMFCVSCGSTDEVEKEGVANLLSKIYAKKLNDNGNNLHYGAEINSYVGYDQSMYYVLAKTDNLDGILKNFGQIYSDFSVSKEEINTQKQDVEQSLLSKSQIDKNIIHKESMRSLYWHSKYGSDIEGTFDSLKKISEDDIKRFKERNYANNRVTIIISGNLKKNNAMELVKKYFSGGKKTSSEIVRMQEPSHHESTIALTRYSNQISVPMVELYWRIPNYRQEKDNALSTEIFINAMSDILQKELIHVQKRVASISISYSSWNYDYGDLCITFTVPDSEKTSDIITAVLTEIKNIACDGITKQQAEIAVQKIVDSCKFVGHDMFDVVDRLSRRIGSGYDFDFLVRYPKFAREYDLNKINAQAKRIFRNDPSVIATIMPVRNTKNAKSDRNNNQ